MATYNRQIKFRRDVAADWTADDPTLASAEIGVETDTWKWKMGDASTAWTSLYYMNRRNFVTGTGSNYSFSTNGEPMHLTFTRDGSARTITLEDDAAHDGQDIIIEVANSAGAGDVSLNTSAATVLGIAASSWSWDGIGTLHLVYDHSSTDYKIVSGGVWDYGEDTDGNWQKFTDTTIEIYDDGFNVAANPTTWTFPSGITLANTTYTVTAVGAGSTDVFATYFNKTTTTVDLYRWRANTGAAAAGVINMRLIGQWV